VVSAPDRRELVRYLIGQELSERRALAIAGMSASAYRYEPRPDPNVVLRQMIYALANRHKRYGVGMIDRASDLRYRRHTRHGPPGGHSGPAEDHSQR
jgi:hypothetical protein